MRYEIKDKRNGEILSWGCSEMALGCNTMYWECEIGAENVEIMVDNEE